MITYSYLHLLTASTTTHRGFSTDTKCCVARPRTTATSTTSASSVALEKVPLLMLTPWKSPSCDLPHFKGVRLERTVTKTTEKICFTKTVNFVLGKSFDSGKGGMMRRALRRSTIVADSGHDHGRTKRYRVPVVPGSTIVVLGVPLRTVTDLTLGVQSPTSSAGQTIPFVNDADERSSAWTLSSICSLASRWRATRQTQSRCASFGNKLTRCAGAAPALGFSGQATNLVTTNTPDVATSSSKACPGRRLRKQSGCSRRRKQDCVRSKSTASESKTLQSANSANTAPKTAKATEQHEWHQHLIRVGRIANENANHSTGGR